MPDDSTFEIRPATPADAPAVKAVVDASFGVYIPRMGKPPLAMLDDHAEVILKHPVYVMTDSTKVIGVLVLIPREDSLYIDTVGILPDYQKRGLGRKLLALAEAEAVRMGYKAVTLMTNVHMTENIAMYGKMGYVETERTTLEGRTVVSMRKPL